MGDTFDQLVKFPYFYAKTDAAMARDPRIKGARVPYKEIKGAAYQDKREKQRKAGRVKAIYLADPHHDVRTKIEWMAQSYANKPVAKISDMDYWVRVFKDSRHRVAGHSEDTLMKQPAIYFKARRRDHTQLKEIEFFDGLRALTIWHR